MANVTRSSRKLKDEDNNSPRQSHIGGKGSIASRSTATDISGLRRSTRETSLKKNNPSIRKSLRLEKLTSVTPFKRKSERVEKLRMPNPHRSTSSGSNKAYKEKNSLDRKRKIDKRKNRKQIVVDAVERTRDKKKDTRVLCLTSPKKRLDSRSYMASFKQEETNAQEPVGQGAKLEVRDELSDQNSDSRVDSDSKEIEEDQDNSSERKEDQVQGEHGEEGCGRSAECSSSGSGRFAEGKNSGAEYNDHLAIASGPSNGDSSPLSKCSGSSLQSCPKGATPIESIEDAEKVKVNCLTEEEERKPDMVEPTSKVRSESSGPESPDLQRACVLGAFTKYRKMEDLDSDASVTATRENICVHAVNAVSASPCGSKRSHSLDRYTGFSKRRRNFHQDGTNYHAMAVDSIPLDEDEGEAAQELCRNMHLEGSSSKIITESDHNVCVICKLGGNLLRRCDGRDCKRSFHFCCLDPPLGDGSPGDWHCMWCVKKKIESGVHSVSKGVESIWDVRETKVSNCEGKQKQYFVKYHGLAHIHNRWIPEDQLVIEASLLLAKFEENQKVVRWKSEWTKPHRLLKKRLLMSPKQHDQFLGDCDYGKLHCQYEWFVKWSGLGYEYATWELENASFLSSPEASILIKQYEDRLEKAKRVSDLSRADKKLREREFTFSKLMELPGRGLSRLNNDHLSIVNKLRECWHKYQDAVFIEDQERILRVILFILSLHSNICRPLLIISTSAIFAWEAEFARLAPSINVVVYNADKDVRECIRKLEFYEEGGCIMFQVLLATPDVVVEDLEALGCIGWEIIIIDEGQNSRMSRHLEQVKKLTADVRLLLVTGPIKDSIPEYLNLLSFVDSGCDGKSVDNLKMHSGDNISWLKERFIQFIASERKSDSSKFVEYWVPVHLSNVQLEQYCATLLSNSISLCSCSKNDPVGARRDILISARKCCDHPYLVDLSLPSLLIKGLSETEFLDVGISASGKLRVLDKILSEIRKRGLRVLIIFQSIGGSARNSIGDILDDFLRQRFGEDSYERVDSGLVTSKKQHALNMFNDKERGRFVFLIENRACLPSIKLSSVDIVMLFDSDWNPLNDLKALQKISIESQFEELKVFRLYSACTVEEKVLVLAKQDVTLDSNLQNINRSTSHMLLSWGAEYLFKRLDEFHAAYTSSLGSNLATEESFSDDVVQELLNQLPNAECTNMMNYSMILKVQQCGSTYYSDVSLPGEMKMQSKNEDLPHVFWTSLLAGKSPQWRFSSGPSPRVRRKAQYFDEVPTKPQNEDDEVVKKRKKVVTNTIDPVSLKSGLKDKQKEVSNKEASDVSGMPEAHMVESEEKRNLRDLQKDLHLSLEPVILKLCDILQLPGAVKDMARRFLQYILNNNHVATDPPPILQAFQISVCWSAASLLKHKISRRDSVALAKHHLDFECKEEEAGLIYCKLRKLKRKFSDQLKKFMEPDFADYPASRTKGVEKHLQVKVSQSKLSDQQELEEGEIRESPKSHNCLDQSVSSKQEQSPDSEKASVSTKINISGSIKKVKKIHSKRMRKLLLKQMEELAEFNKRREEVLEKAKVDLEKKQKLESALIRTIHSQVSVRLDKLRMVDSEFSRKIQALNDRMEARQQMLEAVQLASRNEEKQLMAHWLEEAKSGRQVDSFAMIPLSYSGFRMEQLEGGEQSEADTREIPARMSGPSLEIQDPNGNVPGEAASAEVPSNVSGEVVEAAVWTGLQTFARESGRKKDEMDMTTTMASKDANVIIGTLDGQSSPSMGQIWVHSLGQKAVTSASDSEVPLLQEQIVENIEPSVSAWVSTKDIPFQETQENQNSSQLVKAPLQPAYAVPSNHLVSPSEPELRLPPPPEIPSSGLSQQVEAEENQNSSQQVEAPPQPADAVPSSHLVSPSESELLLPPPSEIPSPGLSQQVEAPLQPADAVPSSHLVSPSEPELLLRPEIPSPGLSQSEIHACNVIENSQSNGGDTSCQQFEVRTQPPEGRNVQHNESRPQPDMASPPGNVMREISSTQTSAPTQPPVVVQNGPLNQSDAQLQQYLPLDNDLGGSGPHSSDSSRGMGIVPEPLNHCSQRAPIASRTYQSLHLDPLQHELARIRKEVDQATKMHEEVKARLNSECEKEIEEIRRKYDNMIQDAAKALLEKRNTLEANYKKVHMNRILAEAFRFNCSDAKGFGVLGLQQGPTQGFMRPVQFSSRQQTQRAATVPAPPVQVVHHSSALFSTNAIRPHVNPAIPPIRNHQVASELRAPAPHLQPFRPASSMSANSPSPLTGVMLPQQSFSSSATTSPTYPPLPATPPLPVMHSSGTFSRIPQSEPAVGLPIFHNSQSALEPLTNIGSHPGGNPSPNVLAPLQGLNFDTWDMSEPAITGAPRSTAAQAGSAGNIVCVSDDDD